MIDSSVYRLDSKEKVLALLKTFSHAQFMSNGKDRSLTVEHFQKTPEKYPHLNLLTIGFDEVGQMWGFENVVKALNGWLVIDRLITQTRGPLCELASSKHVLIVEWKE